MLSHHVPKCYPCHGRPLRGELIVKVKHQRHRWTSTLRALLLPPRDVQRRKLCPGVAPMGHTLAYASWNTTRLRFLGWPSTDEEENMMPAENPSSTWDCGITTKCAKGLNSALHTVTGNASTRRSAAVPLRGRERPLARLHQPILRLHFRRRSLRNTGPGPRPGLPFLSS